MGRPECLGSIEQQESADSTMTEHISYRIGNVDQAGKIKDDVQRDLWGDSNLVPLWKRLRKHHRFLKDFTFHKSSGNGRLSRE
jgi:hypothetical protein